MGYCPCDGNVTGGRSDLKSLATALTTAGLSSSSSILRKL